MVNYDKKLLTNGKIGRTIWGDSMGKVAVIGMVGNSAFLSVEKFNADGETAVAKTIHFEPGGKGFTQAVAAARFGAETSFLGAVGTECYNEIADFLKGDGVAAVLPRKPEPTAYAAILTDAKGANRVTVYQGARLAVEDVETYKAYIAEADVLLLNNEVPLAVNIRALEIAKANNTYVVYNPAPSIPLDPYLVENVDLFTPNEHENQGLENAKDLIVTLGSKGCYVKALESTYPPLKIDNVVDTTGAGDTFNGVLAACIANHRPVERAVIAATCASGVSVTRKYAATAIPTMEEVAAYLKEKGQ